MGRALWTFTDKNYPKPIGTPYIITKLIRTVNRFIGKENTGIFSLFMAIQNSYWVLRGIGELLEVLTLWCSKIMRLGT